MAHAALKRRFLPLKCDFDAYLRRCYVAPVLYRTAAGRCGTILGAVVNDAAKDLVGCSCVTVHASCRVVSGWRTSAGQVLGSLSLSARSRRHWSEPAPLRKRRVNDGCSEQHGPQEFQPCSWKIVRTVAGGCMFLLLPGLLRSMAFVRQLLRRDYERKRLVEAQ